MFAIGAAGEEADLVYNKNKEIMSKFIEANKIPHTRYSVVDYGNKAVVCSTFGDYENSGALGEQVERLERQGDGKALDKALEQSAHLLEHQGRYGALKRVIVFANGKSGANPNHLKKYATALEDSNVKVVTVAVGHDINEDELRHISPDEEAIVKVDPEQNTESTVFAVARRIQGKCFHGNDMKWTYNLWSLSLVLQAVNVDLNISKFVIIHDGTERKLVSSHYFENVILITLKFWQVANCILKFGFA